PGSGPDTDQLLRDLLRRWDESEAAVGIEIGLVQYATWASDQPQVKAALGRLSANQVGDRAWRDSVVRGLLWARGATHRARALDAGNRFATLPPTDWSIVREVIRAEGRVVLLEDEDWQGLLSHALL